MTARSRKMSVVQARLKPKVKAIPDPRPPLRAYVCEYCGYETWTRYESCTECGADLRPERRVRT